MILYYTGCIYLYHMDFIELYIALYNSAPVLPCFVWDDRSKARLDKQLNKDSIKLV